VATVRQFEDLMAWQKARELTRALYRYSSAGAFARDWALQNQLRRAAVSVMANIAEGFERGGDKEFLQFLAVAKGSCGEVRSHLHVGFDQAYFTPEQHAALVENASQVSRLITGLMKHLRQSNMRGSKFKGQPST
jgi:four helix bundle protein